ncbi:MucR family transcriptional regulator [Desulfovibrio psychrotolerans]|uniref:Transcriptional regulator n=1 Tax=Desulfovibrio psychrotolerans TaxID=415242 RepID=A0A7J0BXU3_9BACT|nr:MucR family transcriptional regulator [Desulfovibrio psychrotolerans]GFM38503.1 transcriptional regulator [Desulfovibrio psychrotolerans]
MDDYLKQALEIIKAQASVRTMGEEEISSMMRGLATAIRQIAEGGAEVSAPASDPETDPEKVIREKSVTCLECKRMFKMLTRKHLESHGLTPDEYRAKYGYKKGASLVCKALQRERRKKMKDMKLWEKRAAPAV